MKRGQSSVCKVQETCEKRWLVWCKNAVSISEMSGFQTGCGDNVTHKVNLPQFSDTCWQALGKTG